MAQENPAFTISGTDIPLGLPCSPSNGSLATSNGSAGPIIRNGSKKSIAQISDNPKINRKDIEADDYDPYEHNNVPHPTSNLDTLFHLLKGCFGTGILAMPEAFKFSGYVVGVIGTVLIGFICTLTVHMLMRAEYELARRRRVPTLTYPEAAEAALEDGPEKLRWLSKYMRKIMNIFIIANQMGACTVYIIFVASNIQAVSDTHEVHLSLPVHMSIILGPLILLAWVRDLKYLAPFSTLATIASFCSFGIILFYVFNEVPTVEDRVAVGSVADWPLFIGTALFSLEAIGVMMPLKNEMKTPRDFGGFFGVLNRAMIPIVCLFTCLGLFGYLRFGDDVPGSITLKLGDEWPAQSAKLMMAFAIFVSHALMNYVTFDIVWNQGLQPMCETRKVSNRMQLVFEYIVRTALVLFHFTAGAIFQNLGLIISLIGAFCLSAIGLAFPALIHCTTFWYSCETRGQFVRMVMRDGAIIICAAFALVIGTYTSVLSMIHEFGAKA